MPSHKAFNKCSKCGKTVRAIVTAKDERFLQYLVTELEKMKHVECNECTQYYGWRVIR